MALFALLLFLMFPGCSDNHGNNRILHNPAQMNAPDYRIGVPQGAAAMTAVEEKFPKSKIEYYASLADGYLGVKYGKIDAFAFDRHALQYVAVRNPDLTLMDEKIGDEFIVVGAAKGREDLIEKVNAFIKQYRADGTYQDMYDRWLLGKNLKMPDLPEPKNPTMTLKIGTEGRNEPMNFYADGQLTGFDIEFAKRLALFLNAKFTYQTIDFPSIVTAAETGKIDLLIANLNATPERSKMMLFSDTYVDSEVSFLVRKDRLPPKHAAAITDFSQLDGKKVGVQTGAIYETVLKNKIPKAVPVHFTTFTDQIEALRSGKIKGFLADEVGVLEMMRHTSGITYLKKWLYENEYAFAFAPNQVRLQEQVNAALREMKKDGTLGRLEAKWFGADDTVKVLPDYKLEGKNGVIRFATNSDSVPFVYMKNGTLVGYDIEVAMIIAGKLGRKLQIMDMDFSAIIPSLVSGKTDMAGAFISVTKERAQSVLFSIPNYSGGTVVVVAAGAGPRDNDNLRILPGPDRMNAPEYTIGVPQSAAATTIVEKKFQKSKIKYFQSIADGYVAVQYGKIDAFAFDRHALQYATIQNPDLMVADEKIGDESIVVGAARGREDLIKKVNAFIRQYRADGTYRDMYDRWILGKNLKMPDLPEPENPTMTLKIGTTGVNEPMNFFANGTLSGFDVEFARRLARFLNAKVDFHTIEYPAIVTAALTGKIDLLVANLNATPERREMMLFSDTYVDSEVSFLVRKDRVARNKTNVITDFSQLAGKKVGIVTGSVYDSVLKSQISGAVPEYFNTVADQVEAVKSGKIAGFLVDEPIARDILNHTSGVTTIKKPLTSDGYAFAFGKSRSELRGQFNAALREMQGDGTLKKIDARWFGADDAVKVLPDLKPDGQNGVIRLATSSNLAPFAYIKNGKMVGYDIEISMRVASKLGRRLEIVDMDFAAIIPSLVSGKSDMAAGGITMTPERARSVLFSLPDYTGGIVVVVATGPGAPENPDGPGFWSALGESFRRTFITEDRYKLILEGLKVTIVISVLSAIAGTLLGFGVCMMRRSRSRWAHVPARVFIRVIQGTPIVVLLMILYYIVFGSVDINAILVAVIGFSINFAAYVSEMMRTGIEAVDKGQLEAAHAIGFNKFQVFRRITFPQAARHVLPVFKGEFISMIKMTSIVGYIAIQDLTKMSDIIRSRTYEAFFPLIATALIYFVLAYALAYLLSRVEMSVDPKQRKRVVKGVVHP